ncbi:hypothetical protein BDF22DRAFT_686520 [Syncephalis plumigaleata]|nr:hypothetical protein BDF22DRAFT_686520 [Syncephalis plumigaleata]
MTTLEDILAHLAALSISPSSTSHDAVNAGAAWKEELNKNNVDAHVTKTLVFKPKTAKTAVATPVVVIALEETTVPLGPLAKKINVKEMRMAAPELLQEVFSVEKDNVSPFMLLNVNRDAFPTVHVVIDADLMAATKPLAFHPGQSSKTVCLSAGDVATFLTKANIEYVQVDFKELATTGPPPSTGAASASKSKPAKETKVDDSEAAGTTKIGVEVKKDDDFAKWYQQVLLRSEMMDYYDVSGCYILRPASFNIWKHITAFFDGAITEMGVESAYFPMFVSQRMLEREKDHIEGFAPEVAWVTKAGSSDMEEPVAIRPTSETVMYPYYAKWIRSHRDLPLRLNQWCSVVRWEFKHPQPFLRTREFLWQEGHTAHLTKEGASEEVYQILDLYRQVYEDILAVPVVKGIKSEKEKFAGGLYTTTCEAFIPTTGRGIQGATSHCLGQNFAKMFNIVVEDPNTPADAGEPEKLFVWQNSWGLTTRTIGVMVMVHGDDKGLVLPPRVATVQVIVVPCGITARSTEQDRENINKGVEDVVQILKKAGVRARSDLRDNYTPGYKFNHWELRGVPIRLEVGPKDLENRSTMSVRRDNGAKQAIAVDNLATAVPALLATVQQDMFNRAKATFDQHIIRVDKWNDFVPALNAKNLVLIPWCEREECEDNIKDRSARVAQDAEQDERAPSMGAKSLCIPLEQPKDNAIVEGVTKCVACDHFAKRHTLFGRSY